MSQLSNDYDVCVFKDFDGIVENDRLNAVALGTENAKIQKEIDIVDRNIAAIEKQINQPNDQSIENLFTKATKSKEVYDKQKNKINIFLLTLHEGSKTYRILKSQKHLMIKQVSKTISQS